MPNPDATENTTIEEMVLPSVTSFANCALGPATTLRASNLLSEPKQCILRDVDHYEVGNWLDIPDLEKLEIRHFPPNFLECFGGDNARRKLPLAVKDVTLTLYPNECGDFEELKAWVKARAEAQLPFEKLEVSLDCSAPATLPVDGEFVDSLRSSLAEHVKDVVVQVLRSPQWT